MGLFKWLFGDGKKEKEAETVTLHTEVNITREYVKPEIPSAKVLYKKDLS